MKKIIFTLTIAASLNLWAAYCSSNVRIPAFNIQGSCTKGICTGYMYSEWLTTSGYCNDGSYFSADSHLYSTNLTGRCVNGRLQMRTDSQYLNWYGRCTNGGYFYAPSTYLFSDDVYGSCSANGSFSGSTFTNYGTLQAQCVH